MKTMIENQLQSWKLRLSFRNLTILICFFNVITFLLLLQGFFSAISNKKLTPNQQDAAQLQYIMESEEIRRSMEPVELIKRVKEIEQEAYLVPERGEQKASKQTSAVDLSKRLKSRASGDSNSQRVSALEEWNKRKMERARQRELGKNGTATS
ncbi:hypothetical protein C5167_019573 [Papaver somniferum]|uniref:Uncharacterized protein n=1 Tax=Papaver somniferum TaxID=3469 RepID=A0A4Y7IUI5_PAPSO|nr:uncharacterized protein LOC113353893 isoform X1 [Papaver somniferum]KAI3890729.1 hypothetical protein MKX03_019121 [Papaver bracteatum]RZC51148.1 hypothetical protein C5167_019573 [Papaver somniferum]